MILIISDDETIDVCHAVLDYYLVHQKLRTNRWPTKKDDVYSDDKKVNRLMVKLFNKTMRIYKKKGIKKNE